MKTASEFALELAKKKLPPPPFARRSRLYWRLAPPDPSATDLTDWRTPMRLESSIVIRRAPEEVGRFLADIANIQKWDRGVGSSRAISGSPGVGFEFDTLGRSDSPSAKPEKARMTYRIIRAEADSCTIALTSSSGNARFFKTAQWHFHLSSSPGGSLLTCCADFTLRLRYIFLAPVLYLKRSAIQMDLEGLKRAVEGN